MYGVLWDLVSAMGWIILLPIIIFVAVFEKQIMDGYHGVLGESGIAGSGCFEVPTVCVRIEASKNYGQLTKICPARLDVIQDKSFDLEGIEIIRQYLKDYKLKARPLCVDSIEAVSSMGTEFQEYVLGQKTETEFFAGAQNCIDQYYKKASY